ncbi:MAG: BMP family ABC transporter substrate-binding protein [Treponema sp.]|jgi:basic membrane protein A|nr:BMP family ABC transporter substrate-binding protein [Treponema sp.]
MKKEFGLAMVVMALFTVAACSGKKESAASGGTVAGGKSLNIAIISNVGVDDGSFTQDCYQGILAYTKENPNAKARSIKEPDIGKLIDAASQIVADYDVLVLPGFQFAAIGSVAVNNPDTKFILVDANPTDKGNTVELANVYAMTFKEQESGFFAGVAAALETKTGKVAVVNGIAFPSNVNYQYGFMAGVNYANKNYGASAQYLELPSYAGTDVTGAHVGGNYIGAFSDQPTGKVVGNTLINTGVDVIFVAAGDSGHGVFAAAKEANSVHVIGVDVDQYDEGANGNTNIVLTSVVKVMNVNVTHQLEAIGNGSFTGKNELLDSASDSTGYVNTPGRNQLAANTLAKLEAVAQRMKKGEIIPPSNFSQGITPTDFPGL